VLQYTGVKVKLDQNKTVTIERYEPPVCMDIAVIPENFSQNQMVKIPKNCKYTVLKTVGIVQPMQLDPKIQTYGELEVLAFIKKAQADPKHYILVDSRTQQWYRYGTIPSAVNIPYNAMQQDPDFPEEHVRLMHLLGIEKNKEEYDFSKAKHVLLFCNGA
jgi:rhodanese-related sulfurtransferase